jgi:rhodanese-related sulfurtransferase
MDEIQPNQQEGKKSEIIVAIVICIIAAASIAIIFTWKEPVNVTSSSYTSTYTNVTAEAAYDLMNTTSNLSVIDCRGLEGCSKCQFGHGHLPGAVMNMNAQTLCNETNDILVYSGNGTAGAGFCQDLVDHVYGKIYNLEGGYEAWASAGYPVIQGS